MSTVYSKSIATTIINRHDNFRSNFPTMVKHEKDIESLFRHSIKLGRRLVFFEGGAVLVIPTNRTYHLKPITFLGPCKSLLTVMPCVGAPTAVTFDNCINLRVANIRIKNAQEMHLTFQDCVNVKASNLKVIAPENSPNTDEIHVTRTQNIQITCSLNRTDDDCISIVSGSKNVRATDIICGPGHGMSIGSLGKNKAEDEVSDVVVDRARISGTTNGGGSGYAKNIKFQNIIMHNVTNPIIINQNYCDQLESCPEQHSAVQVTNVVYKNIRGTSASEVAVKLDCSTTFPCNGIVLQNVNPVREGETKAKASCQNVRLPSTERVSPLCQ
ncbi:unnamed protein product [Ilex paraguariensis]|uniref:Uncharacterized protein n=1 Tax=Ilex paraguariensis TaxID=185542 RepID=A0ABC8TJB7_9AQUA